MATHDRFEDLSTPELFRIVGSAPKAEEAALAYLERVQRRLGGYVRNRLGRRSADLPDAGQTIFLHSWEHRPVAPTEPKEFEGWLFSIARAVCVDATRLRRPVSGLSECVRAFSGPGPHTTVRKKEESSLLRQALGQLPEEHAELLKQHHVEGVSTEELAKQRGEATRTIRKKLTAARSLARLALKKVGITDAA